MRTASLGGCLGCIETENKVGIACSSKNKRIIGAASTIGDSDMGHWYLHRFSRSNGFAFQNQIYAEAYRNTGSGIVDQTAYIICVSK